MVSNGSYLVTSIILYRFYVKDYFINILPDLRQLIQSIPYISKLILFYFLLYLIMGTTIITIIPILILLIHYYLLLLTTR